MPKQELSTPSFDITHLLVSNIVIEPYHNSRCNCDTDSLNELMASIKHRGILQPLIVRTKPEYDGKYYLVAGERRLHAAKRLGMEGVPCILYQKMTDVNASYTQFIENAHRENLNPVEYAVGLSKLMGQEIELFDKTTKTKKILKINTKMLATLCGFSVGKISQYLNLLELPVTILEGIREGKINFSQARVLCAVDNCDTQLAVYKKIVAGDLTGVVDVQAEVDRVRKEEDEQAINTTTEERKQNVKDINSANDTDTIVGDGVCGSINVGDDSSMSIENSMNRLHDLRDTEITVRSSDAIRKGLALHYKRYDRVRTVEKRQYLEGFIAALEWSIGLRSTFNSNKRH